MPESIKSVFRSVIRHYRHVDLAGTSISDI